MAFNNLEFRVLKKMKLLNFFNVSKKVSYGSHKFNVPVINGLGYPNLFLKPNWLYFLVNELFTDDSETFVDVGANIGQTLISVKAVNKEISYIGFEPNASCVYYLKNLIRENRFTNCCVYSFALSDRLKEDFLETNGEADPTGSLIHDQRPNFFKHSESVFSLAFDSLGLDRKIFCIKIDVEGAELEALLGMEKLLATRRPYIICEVLDSFSDNVLNFTQDRADQLCTILRKHDYYIVQLVQNETTTKVIGHNVLNTISIRQWAKESLILNDYLFFPAEKEIAVKTALTKLCDQAN